MIGPASRGISTSAYLALRAVMVFDALLLVTVAVLLWLFMERPAGLVGACLCVVLAAACLGATRWLDRVHDRAR